VLWKKRTLLSTLGAVLFGPKAEAFFPRGSVGHPANWYNPAWLYRKQITVDHTKVSSAGGETYASYPLMASRATDSDLAAHAQSNGNDILFTSSDGVTKLNHEIEAYTSATGALKAWVKVAGLSSSVNTVFFMYYGNPAASNQQNVTGTWDTHYKGVYHLSAQDGWINTNRSGANPVINYGGGGWKNIQVSDPCIIPDPSDANKLIMFYIGIAAFAPGGISIGRATASISAPTVWTEYAGNPIIPNATSPRADSVIYDSGTFYLYSSNNSNLTDIDLFTSTDGFMFTRTASILTPTGQGRNDGIAVRQGAVIKEGALWTMVYNYSTSGGGTNIGFKYATSSDGVTWTKQGGTPGVLFDHGIEGSADWKGLEWHQLLKIGSTYYLTYECFNGSSYTICMATASAVSGPWTKVNLNSVFKPSYVPSAFDEWHVATAAWQNISGAWWLIYSGGDLFAPYDGSHWAMGMMSMTDQNGNPLSPADVVQRNVLDSTSNANHLGGVNLAPNGGNGFTFDGASSHAISTTPASFATSNYTMQAWLRPSALSQATVAAMNGLNGGVGGSGIGFGMGDAAGGVGAKLVGIASSSAWMDSGYSFSSTVNRISVSMVNSGGTTTWLVNGANPGGTSSAGVITPTQSFSIGNSSGNGQSWGGDIDEVRFSDAVRSAGWLTTEYANQSDPASFYSVGAETPY